MDNSYIEHRKAVIQHYLKNGSLRKTAKNFGIHYQTLYRWLKIYRKIKEEFFIANYQPPWNRTSIKLENSIKLLKERNPALTIKNAQELLRKKGIKISYRTIWSIWNRYGYTGINKKISEKEQGVNKWSPEARKKFSCAMQLFNNGKIEESARMLNSIPSLPPNELLPKIPDQFLSLPRRLEKSISLFGKIPISENLTQLVSLYNEAKKKKLHYLAIRAGLAQIALLSWKGDLTQQKKLLAEIKKMFNQKGRKQSQTTFNLFFIMLIAEANLCIDLFKINQAYQIASACRLSLTRRKRPEPDLILHLARLYVRLGEIKKAEYWYQKALTEMPVEMKKELNTQLAINICFMKGEYKRAMMLLKDTNLPEWIRTALPLRFKSLYYLIKGSPNMAIETATKSLNLSKEQELPRDIFNSYLVIAASYNTIGEKNKAVKILRNLKQYIKKFRLTTQEKMLQIILKKNLEWTEGFNLPILRIGFLLRKSRYRQALLLAKKKGLITIFYRYIFFIPEPILHLLKKGKNTGLPKTILKLPIFNQDTIAFYVKFIGKLTITKNQKPVKASLKPKDESLLIHLCLRLNTPDSFLYLDDLFKNFWRNNAKAPRNLSHSLNRIKKNLNIPGHCLEIKYDSGKPCLINRNIYFTTDYQDIFHTLSQAKALERAGEWEFAKKEYLRAFRLFRGEPFKKNFDTWSVDARFKILTQFETEAINFAKSCIERGDRVDAKRILQKVLKIIPDSEEAKSVLDGLISR